MQVCNVTNAKLCVYAGKQHTHCCLRKMLHKSQKVKEKLENNVLFLKTRDPVR